ncbi:hypothetical protein SPRG_09175 [Saprolegnia parasitica CBS 223.65]|uniref:Uncharacterized protein n=1 Tax=Saprolegnia parasitica (strain CBS 223.65) TaxID=695850 RepID=A0A067C855_SAPPC|nr:hypothetical protein SPRG_09175 [Saprolegnia parasitica CBS 223.65]KDO25350.1 hypothetical protein SPRG_09175 [Saprolegnia parasitica CBS 223.65]|eukprot:XP_012203999.1 hypothetical protein SPRG_09175 [Saprolegnia parasitica CBS 223.65]
MEITDKEERLRERRRLKQQRHRARDLDEQKDLERQLYVLQNFLAKYKAHADTALPWKQVAFALQDAVDDATTVNIQLRQQVEQLSRLAHSLASRTIDHGFISVPASRPTPQRWAGRLKGLTL